MRAANRQSPTSQDSPPPTTAARTLLYVVNWDWFFLSHRLPLALAARERGDRVLVATVDTGRSGEIESHGFVFVPIPLAPHGLNPFAEAASIVRLAALYRELRPDLIHHVTIKPVLYGSLAARVVPSAGVVNAISGLGWMYSEAPGATRLRRLINLVYRVALRRENARTVFQNPDDRRCFVAWGLVPEDRTVLIRGSGVDTERFDFREEPEAEPLVLLPARLLWSKGVAELVEAARIVRRERPEVRFALVGAPDAGNPQSVPPAVLEGWRREGIVELWGHRNDMPDALAAARIVALPTYYPEGLPKALLEAAAIGRVMVTTDIPGCREVVQHERTGLLVPPRDPVALAEAIVRLLEDPPLRRRLRCAARAHVVEQFSVPLVVGQTLALYDELCPPASLAVPDDRGA